MSINLILIVLILVVLTLGLYFFVKRTLNFEDDAKGTENFTSIETLEAYVYETISSTIRQQLKDLDLTEQQTKQREILKTELREAQFNAAHGDSKAKKFLKHQIIRIITDKRGKLFVTDATIENIIPYSLPRALKIRDKFAILLYYYTNMLEHEVIDKKTKKKKIVPYGGAGIQKMISDNNLDAKMEARDEDGNVITYIDDDGNEQIEYLDFYDITPERIERAYQNVIVKQNIRLTYQDKLNLLSQRIFEDQFALGVADTLLDTTVDEVQGGVNGIPAGKYEIDDEELQNAEYSYKSLWIVNHGKKIKVSALSFGSQDELMRVTQNIYKYEPPEPLSKNAGKVVATMKNGARVVVFRDPFQLGPGFIVRKFDSAPSVAPDALLRDPGADIPILTSKWCIKGMFNTAVTGEQGTGKTTWLKSIVRFIREDYSIRTMELTRELNLNFTYPRRNILSFVETDHISAQDGLDFLKKSSADITIIGEVASAIAAAWIIQTAKVASRMALFTHHAKTAYDLVVAIRNNVMECGNFTNEKSVDRMVAECININMHFENESGHRYMERVTYIKPVFGEEYPCNDLSKSDDIERDALLNEDEFRKRLTDRQTFVWNDVCRYNKELGRYQFLGFDEEMFKQIKANVSEHEYAQFKREYNYMVELEEKLKAQDIRDSKEMGYAGIKA